MCINNEFVLNALLSPSLGGGGSWDIQLTCHMCTLYLAQIGWGHMGVGGPGTSLNHKMAIQPQPLGAQTINGLRTTISSALCVCVCVRDLV